MEEVKKTYKMYKEVIKVLGAILSDDSKIVLSAYSGIPQGHSIALSFAKGTLTAKVAELKKLKGSGDDLLTSADSALAYAPSDVKRIYWQDDRPMNNNLMVEMEEVNLKEGQNIKLGEKTYNFVRNLNWKTFGTHFVVVSPIEEVEEVVVDNEKEDVDKEVS